jgi:hypothetical protein
VRPDALDDPGLSSDPPDNAPGTMPVQPAAICGQEDRAFDTLADGCRSGGKARPLRPCPALPARFGSSRVPNSPSGTSWMNAFSVPQALEGMLQRVLAPSLLRRRLRAPPPWDPTQIRRRRWAGDGQERSS